MLRSRGGPTRGLLLPSPLLPVLLRGSLGQQWGREGAGLASCPGTCGGIAHFGTQLAALIVCPCHVQLKVGAATAWLLGGLGPLAGLAGCPLGRTTRATCTWLALWRLGVVGAHHDGLERNYLAKWVIVHCGNSCWISAVGVTHAGHLAPGPPDFGLGRILLTVLS